MLVAADETTEVKKEREAKEIIKQERRESILSNASVGCLEYIDDIQNN